MVNSRDMLAAGLGVVLSLVLFLARAPAEEDAGVQWPHPDVAALPDGPDKDQIAYGEKLITKTFAVIGPEVKDPAMRYAGNNLACSSCHLDGGRRRLGLSLIGVHGAYPANMARENESRTLEQRINGCLERSMNGRLLPEKSAEVEAMVAYIAFLSEDAPEGVSGRSTPQLALLDRAADPKRGERVYRARCVACHGMNGQGMRRGPKGSARGYLYPPLWGEDSFNSGAGMHRLITSARYIHANMPFGATADSPMLTVEEAWDVAAYINAKTRPQKAGLELDYPDRSRKPVDAPFPPFEDDFPMEQHILGPYQPILDAREGR